MCTVVRTCMRSELHRWLRLQRSPSRITTLGGGFVQVAGRVSRCWKVQARDGSSFRQIRNCPRKIGIVDKLEAAFAAGLTSRGVRSVFRIVDKGLGCFRRWKLQKCLLACQRTRCSVGVGNDGVHPPLFRKPSPSFCLEVRW
jgi:hypothetical protein